MAFPAAPIVGQQFTTPAGQIYEYITAGGWALVRDTTFSVNYWNENTAIDSAADFILWFDSSTGLHRKIRVSDLATLLGTTVTITNPSGVSLI